MRLTQILRKELIIGTLLTASIAIANLGCEQQPYRKVHKDCYGLHIRENKDNITLEFYKEGYLVFEKRVGSPIELKITATEIHYRDNIGTKTYKLETTAEKDSK